MKKILLYSIVISLLFTSLAVLGSYLGDLHWTLDLLSHFKLQYTWLLVFGILGLCLFKKQKTALYFMLYFIIPLICCLSDIVPLYIGGTKNVQLQETIKIACINILSSNQAYDAVTDYIRKKDPDIVVIQELSPLWAAVLSDKLQAYPHQTIIPRDDNFGMAIYSRLAFDSVEIVSLGTANVPSILCSFQLSGKRVRLLATHPPPPVGADYFAHRNRQLDDIASLVKADDSEFILIGDLNSSSYSTHFKRLVCETGLLDSRRGFGMLATWPTHNFLLRCTLDHCLHSNGLSVKTRERGDFVGSDHLPIFVELGNR